jgi:hypothetical protein
MHQLDNPFAESLDVNTRLLFLPSTLLRLESRDK